MPLHSHHKMIRRSSFDRFHNPIIRTSCHQPQSLADSVGGLMMRGIHRKNQGRTLGVARPADSSPAATEVGSDFVTIFPSVDSESIVTV